jgi:hypothetical protein
MSSSKSANTSSSGISGVFLLTLIVVAMGIAASGCAGKKAMQTEQLLAVSGFHMKLADTPEQLDHLKTFTQKRLVPHKRDGNVYYVYADAATCKCVYVGDEKAYKHYEDLIEEEKVVKEELQASDEVRMEEDESFNWDLWGAWPWW